MAGTPNSLITPQAVKTATAVVTTAKSNLTDTTNVVKLLANDAIPNGALIKHIYAIPRGTTTQDIQVQLYRSYNFGVTVFLSETSIIQAQTINSTGPISRAEFSATQDTPMRVQAAEELWVAASTAVTSGIVFHIEYEAF